MDPAAVSGTAQVAQRWSTGLADLAERYPTWIAEVRQTGVVIGLRMHVDMGGMLMTRLLFDEGSLGDVRRVRSVGAAGETRGY